GANLGLGVLVRHEKSTRPVSFLTPHLRSHCLLPTLHARLSSIRSTWREYFGEPTDAALENICAAAVSGTFVRNLPPRTKFCQRLRRRRAFVTRHISPEPSTEPLGSRRAS